MVATSRAFLGAAMIACCGLTSCMAQAETKPSESVQPAPATMINGKPEGLYYMQKMWIATR